jgi:uncharacterized membrane protein YtjA (UPF0391 family)
MARMENLRRFLRQAECPGTPSGTSLAGCNPMLTWAITFLLIAIFAGVFGFVAAGPAGLILFAVFFVLFIGALIRERGTRKGP